MGQIHPFGKVGEDGRERMSVLDWVLWGVLVVTFLVLLALMSSGCGAAHRDPRGAHLNNNVTRIMYNPKLCQELPDGRVKCKEVTFTLGTVDVRDLHK